MSDMPHTRNWRVLLVEDNPGDANLAKEYLEQVNPALGFVVDWCDRLETAINRLDSEAFDGVILDLGLPDSQGLATFSAIRSCAADVPILVLTGNDDLETGLAAVQAGAADFLSKEKIDEETLGRAVRYAIERASSERRYRQLFEGSLAGVYVTSLDGEILDANEAFARLLGYPSLEALQALCAEDLYANQHDRDVFLAKLRSHGHVTSHRATLRHRTGAEVPTLENARLLEDDSGNPTRVEGTVIDLTEHEEMERRRALLGSVLAILNRPNEWAHLVHDILEEIRAVTRFDAVGIRLRDNGDYAYAAAEGFPDEFLATERSICARGEDGLPLRDADGAPILECMCGNVIQGRTDPSLPFFTELGSFWTNSTTELLASTTEEERQASTRNQCNAFGYESVALVPVQSGTETVGLLQLNDARKGMLTLEAVQFLEELAASIGVAHKRQETETHIRSLLRIQTHVNRLSLELGRTLDLREACSAIYEHVRSLADADVFVVSLFEVGRDRLTPCHVVVRGETLDLSVSQAPLPSAMSDAALLQVVHTGEPIIAGDLNLVEDVSRRSTEPTEKSATSGDLADRDPEGDTSAARSALLVPMSVEGSVIGTIAITSRLRDAYGESHEEILAGMANVSAIAIRNAQLVRRIEGDAAEARAMLAGTTQALSRVTETRDPYTAGHQARVAELAVAIAEEMGLDEDACDTLRTCGLLHDIGKMSVPAEILSKPTHLKDTEYDLIKQHVENGFNILKTSQLPWQIAEIVLQHHERLDGSGYPRGVRKDGLMLEARILAVADVVEAMSSHRPYRPALGVNAALEEVETHRGRLYDDTVVDACVALFREKGFEFAG